MLNLSALSDFRGRRAGFPTCRAVAGKETRPTGPILPDIPKSQFQSRKEEGSVAIIPIMDVVGNEVKSRLIVGDLLSTDSLAFSNACVSLTEGPAFPWMLSIRKRIPRRAWNELNH